MKIETLRYLFKVGDSQEIMEIYIPEFKIAFNEAGAVFACENPRDSHVIKTEIDRNDALLLFYVVSNRPNVDKIVKTYFPKE